MLDGLRVNQLSLARRLSGEMALTEPRLLLKGRGAGRQGNELLELDLALPPSPLATRPAPGPDGKLPLLLYCPPAFAAAHAVAVQQVPPALQQQGVAAGQQQQQQMVGAGGEGGDGDQQQQLLSAAAAAAEVEASLSDAQCVSHVLLRRGDLHFSSTVSDQLSVLIHRIFTPVARLPKYIGCVEVESVLARPANHGKESTV